MNATTTSDESLDQMLLGDDALLGGLQPAEGLPLEEPAPMMPAAEGKSSAADTISDEELNAMLEIPVWEFEGELGAGVGYTDNALQSSFPEQPSPFLFAEAEFYAVRYPQNDKQGFVQFLVIAEYDYFTDVPEVPDENLFWIQASISQPAGADAETGATLRYLYTKQVYNSVFAGIDPAINTSNPFLFEAHGAGFEGYAEWQLSGNNAVRLETVIDRYVFPGTGSDYTQPAIGLEWEHQLDKRGSKYSLGYEFALRLTDERLQRDSSGFSIPDSQLNMYYHEVDFAWKQYWWEDQSFYTRSRARLRLLKDNGVGYENYNLYRLGQIFHWDLDPVSFEASAEFYYYAYPNQPVDTSNPDLRFLSQLEIGAELTYTFNDQWSSSLEYTYTFTRSNRGEDQYNANVIQMGVTRHF